MKTPIGKIPLIAQDEVEYDFDTGHSAVCARHPDVVIGHGDCATCENEAGELPEEPAYDNRTAQDARDRVIQARMGSLTDPTEKYLETLEAELVVWLEAIRHERHRRMVQTWQQGDY